MFVGRKEEMVFFDKRYKSNNAEFVVLYGRRRIGKTELLKEFSKNKKHIFYASIETSNKNQLELFSKSLLKNHPMNKFITKFDSWEESFTFLGELAKDERIVLIIDEFPYMVQSSGSVPSLLQNAWDHHLKDTNLMLIICGSSMSFMEKEVLASKNPLYGRTTGIYKLEEMNVFTSAQIIGDASFEDWIRYYAVFSGVPHYLSKINSDKDLGGNIVEHILERGSSLFTEVDFLMRQELREVNSYNTIIQAIALGSTKLNEIEGKTGLDRTKIPYYLNNLIELGIVKKEFPATLPIKQKSKSRKGLYQLDNNFFKFYFTFVYPNMSELMDNESDEVYRELVEPHLDFYTSTIFEQVCIQYLKKINKEKAAPFRLKNLGRWWEKGAEIDIVSFDQKENLLVGECKWKKSEVGIKEYRQLMNKVPLLKQAYKNVWYYLFSRSGFTEELIKLAENDEKVRLVYIEDIFS